MNSRSDKPNSARRVRREEPTESKRQRSEKEAVTKEAKGGSYNVVLEIRTGLNKIETKLDKSTRAIEELLSKEVRKTEKRESDARVITSDVGELFGDLKRIDTKVAKHSEVDEKLLKALRLASQESKKMEKILLEVQMERDVLLEKMQSYLEQNSSLKSKIEEQRCSVGAYERQVNAEYEIRLRKLESVNEDLRNTALQKEKQLKEANEQLKQMYRTLKSHEELSWKKKNEETVFISILKNDLQAIWNEKIKMEEEFKRLKRLCGVTEQDMQPKMSSEDYLGNILRRSKSMSDLTLHVNSKTSNSVENAEKTSSNVAPDSTNTTLRCPSKNSHGEGSSPETTPLESALEQKIFQEAEKKLS